MYEDTDICDCIDPANVSREEAECWGFLYFSMYYDIFHTWKI